MSKIVMLPPALYSVYDVRSFAFVGRKKNARKKAICVNLLSQTVEQIIFCNASNVSIPYFVWISKVIVKIRSALMYSSKPLKHPIKISTATATVPATNIKRNIARMDN